MRRIEANLSTREEWRGCTHAHAGKQINTHTHTHTHICLHGRTNLRSQRAVRVCAQTYADN